MNLDWWLKRYLKERPLFLSLIRAKEAFIFQTFIPFKKPVIDIGCGDGFFAKVAFGRVEIGLDVKESRIDQSKKANVYDKIVVYNGEKMPIKSASVSTAVSNCVLEHIENLEEVIGEVHRILKPGGKFIVSVMAKPWEDNLIGALVLGNSYKQWLKQKQVHFNLLNDRDWKNLFLKTGFKVQEEIGYLSPTACRLIELSHYISIPSLITYKLFGKWVIGPVFYPIWYLANILNENVEPNQSGAIFWVLVKP